MRGRHLQNPRFCVRIRRIGRIFVRDISKLRTPRKGEKETVFHTGSHWLIGFRDTGTWLSRLSVTSRCCMLFSVFGIASRAPKELKRASWQIGYENKQLRNL